MSLRPPPGRRVLSAGYGQKPGSGAGGASQRPRAKPSPFGGEMKADFNLNFAAPKKEFVVNWARYKGHEKKREKHAMNDFRRKLIRAAFKVLDEDGSGVVTLEDIKGRWDASKHPDVVLGKRSEESVLLEFIAKFEEGSEEKDGKVTFEEFVQYYDKVGEELTDGYFAVMICNAWGISPDDADDPTGGLAQLKRNAMKVDITEKDQAAMRSIRNDISSGKMEKALAKLFHMTNQMENGAVKLVRMDFHHWFGPFSQSSDQVVYRNAAKFLRDLSLNDTALAVVSKPAAKVLIETFISPVSAGYDPVARSYAAAVKEKLLEVQQRA